MHTLACAKKNWRACLCETRLQKLFKSTHAQLCICEGNDVVSGSFSHTYIIIAVGFTGSRWWSIRMKTSITVVSPEVSLRGQMHSKHIYRSVWLKRQTNKQRQTVLAGLPYNDVADAVDRKCFSVFISGSCRSEGRRGASRSTWSCCKYTAT